MASATPITDRIVSDVNYARGVELVRTCGEGLTLGDAGAARRQAVASKRSGERNTRAYWLGIARELRTRRLPELDKVADTLNIELPPSRPSGALTSFPAGTRIVTAQGRTGTVVGTGAASARYGLCMRVRFDTGATYDVSITALTLAEPRTLNVSPATGMDGSDPDAAVCARCHTRADWHDAMDGACPEDADAPHPYSIAADALSQVEPTAHPLDKAAPVSFTETEADALYAMLTQRAYLRTDDPERDAVVSARDKVYPFTTAAREENEARAILTACDHGAGEVVTCGSCLRSWCGACDPAPSALCHYCHGRGHSEAPR
jgi:hypothetical protein